MFIWQNVIVSLRTGVNMYPAESLGAEFLALEAHGCVGVTDTELHYPHCREAAMSPARLEPRITVLTTARNNFQDRHSRHFNL